jgi:hypothetical protein
MPWPFEDIFAGPDPAPPEDAEDWSPLEELERAVAVLAVRLKHEPGLSRAAAMLFVKTSTNVPGVCFRSIVWPEARRVAGLPAQKRGRPPKRAGELAPK